MAATGLDYGSREAARLFATLRVEADGRLPVTLDQLAGLYAMAWESGRIAGRLSVADVFADTVQTFNEGIV